MATKTLEEVTQILEAQQKKVQRLEDVYEIQNLMGRYVYLHEVGRDYEFPDTLYAQKAPGVSSEVANFGAAVGLEGIRKKYSTFKGGGDKKGLLFTHPLTTPVIEVAGDGKTAKGLWISPGYETQKDRETGEIMSCFCYTKYGCDFVKEDGKWKVWHYHVYRVFLTPWNKGFTENWELKREAPKPRYETQLPPTYDHPYSVDTELELVPAPPQPYETWEDTFSYGP
jgi:hypothetical protein